jgi:pyruvate ferredoxin oxidoreductase gamma subunit
MFGVRFHGRGGQGVITYAEILAAAAYGEGRYAQAFPNVGPERLGAPVVAYCRIDERPLRLRDPVVSPDALVLADTALLGVVDVLGGLRPDGYLVVNSALGLSDLGLAGFAAERPLRHVLRLPANDLARQFLGEALPGAALLGAFAAMTRAVSLEAVEGAIRAAFRKVGDRRVIDGQVETARMGFRVVLERSRELTDV